MSDFEHDIARVLTAIEALPPKKGGRGVIGIAGPPASGKSTLAEEIVRRINSQEAGRAALVPMDGWHLDNPILEERGLRARKGAPETFNAADFCETLAALSTSKNEAFIPRFDRDRDAAIAHAIRVAPKTQDLIVEGNYLLLQDAPWDRLRELFDLSVFLGPPLAVLKARLGQRWEEQGYTPAQIEPQIASDLKNAALILEHSAEADLRLGGVEKNVTVNCISVLSR